MATNISIWLDDNVFSEMKKIKETSNLNWAQILELGIFSLSKVEKGSANLGKAEKGSKVDVGGANWSKLFNFKREV